MRDEDPFDAPLDPHLIDFTAGWNRLLREGLEPIYTSSFDGGDGGIMRLEARQLSGLYTLTYNMCVQEIPYNWSAKIYYALKDELDRVSAEKVLGKLRESAGNGEELLAAFEEVWRRWLVAMKQVKAIFGYLDRFYVARLRLRKVQQIGIRSFYDHVFVHLKEDITVAFLEAVAKDRAKHLSAHHDNGSVIRNDEVSAGSTCVDSPESESEILQEEGRSGSCGVTHALLRRVAIIFQKLGMDVYRDELELPLLQATERYLKSESEEWLTNHTASMYLYHVRAVVKAESWRVSQLLNESTMQKMVDVCHQQLLAERLDCIISSDTGCAFMLENGHKDELKLLFTLLSNVRCAMPRIAGCFRQYLLKKGNVLTKDESLLNRSNLKRKGENEKNLTEAVLQLHEENCNLLSECFKGHHAFHKALKDAFEEFLNLPIQGALDISQIITDYLDRALRKLPQEMTLVSSTEESSREKYHNPSLVRHLCKVVDVFKYVNEKDVFAELYRKKMAKRLLLERTRSIAMESEIVEKIASTCGRPFASKLSGMLSDLRTTESFDDAWQKFLAEENVGLRFDVRVKALSAGFWPSYRSESLRLPACLTLARERFEEFYATKTSSRRLSWIHSLGSVWVKHDTGTVLMLNTFQACILLLFNTHQRLSVSQIAGHLGLEAAQVNKYVQSLCVRKYQLLRCEEQNNGDHVLVVNDDFQSKRERVRVPMIPSLSKMGEKDKEKSYKKVYDDRKFAMDATLVRVMKASKKMEERDLIKEAIQELSVLFKVDSSMLRKRLKDLVEREYLASISSSYEYIQ